MNSRESYQQVIEDIFGAGVSTFDCSKDIRNNVTGAINNENYRPFTRNFVARLERLRTTYEGHVSFGDLLRQVNIVAESGLWRGAVAELAAYDFLSWKILEGDRILSEPAELNVDLRKEQTYAAELGKKFANVDGCFRGIDVYFDVKCLGDAASALLRSAIKEIVSELDIPGLWIVPEFAKDLDYELIQDNWCALKHELIRAARHNQVVNQVKSNVVKGLGFSLKRGPGVMATESSHNPYRHAEVYWSRVFGHCDKFVKNSPFMLVYVVFPWFNNTLRPHGGESLTFYRALTRRVFCQWIGHKTRLDTVLDDFHSDCTICEVSQSLSGILFLEDNVIQGENPDHHNLIAHMYLNPNAEHSLKRTLFFDFALTSGLDTFDDFEHDNY
ncbi:MAG: hypothetical protein KKG33_01440 [candidate division Zixibacteria bacterium]|nr:hypothetical protein [candidate division Zixibacteria bacterium]MBU1469450.1 hypothetical protein [candidate division Zixibacteria bacterium]MBU2624204.1 hypothetical protein [candidate division Zixibacteria bacterium]